MSTTLQFTDGKELVINQAPWANWELEIQHKDGTGRDAAHAIEPNAGYSIAVHQRDCLFRRREVSSRPAERLAEYRRCKIDEVVVDEQNRGWLIFENGQRYGAKGLLSLLYSSDRTWQRYVERKSDQQGAVWHQWENIRERSTVPAPPSCSSLNVRQVSGSGSRTQVNKFLEGGPDGLVDHSLGGVHVWKAAFIAEYEGETIAALVLSTPASPHADAEKELVISRLACHPARPKNTSSWFIARAREWARDQDYERLVAYAGVGGNDGTCYDAAGFEHRETVRADGSGWTNRDGRDEVAGGRQWQRSKWVYDLD